MLAELQDGFPGKYEDGSLRTLQRRMRDWRAVHGPEREVMFAQEHVAGREGAFDFTNANELEVTLNGEPFEHLLFEFVLSFSGWTYTQLAYSETFEAMSSGLQGAVWELGGVPAVWRSDNLSAATHEIRLTGGRRLTRRYADLLAHYRASSTRIEPGESHQNGVAEQKHGRTKSLLSQHLTIRGSRDFCSVEEYEAFVEGVVSRSNRGREAKLALEREQLVALPPMRLPTYTTYHPSRPSGQHGAGRQADVLGAVAADRARRRGTAARHGGGGLLRGQADRDDAAHPG